jgi:hypothetical protein
MEMEDIIAYSIIAIFTLVVIFGAVLLRRRFVRSRTRKVTQMKQHLDQDAEAHDKFYRRQQKQDRLLAQARAEEAVQLRDRAERLRIKGFQNVTPVHQNAGNASTQSTTNDSQWRTLGGGDKTTTAQPDSNRTSDLFTGMAIGSLVNSLFSSPSYSRPSADDSDSIKSSSSSWSDSSSSDSSSSWSDSSSSDSGPSSDW